MKRQQKNSWKNRFRSFFTNQKRRRPGNRNILCLESLEKRQMLSGVPWVPTGIAEAPIAEAAASVPAAEVAAAADAAAAKVPGKESPEAMKATVTPDVAPATPPADGESLDAEPAGVNEGSNRADDGLDGGAFDTLPDAEMFQEIGEIDRLMQGLEEAFAFPDLEDGVPGQPSGPTVDGLQQRVLGDGSSGIDVGFGSGLSAMDRIHNQFSNDAPPRGGGIGSDPRVGQPPATRGQSGNGSNAVVGAATRAFSIVAGCATSLRTGDADYCVRAVAPVFTTPNVSHTRNPSEPPRPPQGPGPVYWCYNDPNPWLILPPLVCEPLPGMDVNERMCASGADAPAADGEGEMCEPLMSAPLMSVPPADTPDPGSESGGTEGPVPDGGANTRQPARSSDDDSQSNSSGSEQSEETDSCQAESSEESNNEKDRSSDEDGDDSTADSKGKEKGHDEGSSDDSKGKEKDKGCPPKGGEDDYGYDPRLPNPGSEPGGPNPFDQHRVGQGNPEEHDHGGLTPIEASVRPATPLTTLDVTGQPGEAPTRSLAGRPFSIDPVVNPGKHF